MTDNKAAIPLFQQIDILNTIIVTPNRRLSATLHKLYQQYQLDQQRQSWQTPLILPINSWMQQAWIEQTQRSTDEPPLLLNQTQEQFLWETVLNEASAAAELLQMSETAHLVKSAWGLLKQWQVNTDLPAFHATEDYAALHTWITAFEKSCDDNHWLDNATLPDKIIDAIQKDKIRLPAKIIAVGFTEFSPQLKKLFTLCENKQCVVIQSELSQNHTHPTRLSISDNENEILTMARWAKSIWSSQKEASIGCVVPNLDKNRERVKQIFSEVFAPVDYFTVDPDAAPFNISAGKSLLEYPIIKIALQLLNLYKKKIPLELLSHILTSPFVGNAESERIKRANFDSILRKANIITVDLTTLLQETEDPKKISLIKSCPQLAKRIQEFFALYAKQEKTQSHSQWAEFFNTLLTVLGWPGERSLNSPEYQVVENWLKILAEYQTLDQISGPISYYQALQSLNKIVAKNIFQPKTPDAPIQVLGVLEAAGLPFDYLWVAGMDDISWPPQPKPNPFIPKNIQRELQMPHATAERELKFCQALTQQFIHHAKHIIFSHAEKDEALELQPSPLIRNFTSITVEDLALPPYLSPCERIYQSKKLEWLHDEVALPLQTEEKITGGVSVLKQQAMCPFKAFAEWRLHAHELENPLPGLRAKDRGTIIHKALELVWDDLRTQEKLISLDLNELNFLVNQSIDKALETTPHTRHADLKYISLEKSRLNKLIHDWLQVEKNRSPFKVMMSEKTAQITLNQLKLSIRIDRIDELADGQKLIIDYKTGKHNDINHWFGERPEEPQLPLYSLIDKERTIGITFAQIATGENCFKGVSRHSLEMDGVKVVSEVKKSAVSWAEQLSQWDTVLTKLSDDFSQGIAKVDPKEKPQTCTWCALKPLCRINEEIFENHE